MRGAEAGWWCGALAAGALLLALWCRRRRAKRQPHQVHVVRNWSAGGVLPPPVLVRVLSAPLSAPHCAPHCAPRAPPVPRRAAEALSSAPADDVPVPPQIVIVDNPHPAPSTPAPAPGPSELVNIPKLPLPEQWLHKPIDYKYAPILRPLIAGELGAELTQETRAKKFSATRSPSLEKDDKSPFLWSAKSDKVFGFDPISVEKLGTKMGDEMTSPAKRDDDDDVSPGNLRRFRSVSTKLNMCSVNEGLHEGQQERLEMQNSPRILECSSAKEKSSAPKFDFSPRLLAETMVSPRFFTPPETVSPMFFAEPSPKSVYYDTVRSPKFFPETPFRDPEVPQSPRILGDPVNRNGTDKPSSPRIVNRPSPKVHSCNKENYFTFEQTCLEEARSSPRPKKYGGRNSIERERFTPPADKEVKKYRRHNSCDTNYKTIELNITKCDDNKETESKGEDVIDYSKIVALESEPKCDEKSNELAPCSSNSAQMRRQRLKSISLDSDNAKIIEQNLGLPIAKQLKDQMNEAYKNQDVSASCESMERHLKTPPNDRPIFKFDETKDKETDEPKSPDIKQKKCLRQSSDTQSFIDMPRFSPKEFEITVTTEEGDTTTAETQTKKKVKNLRNLRIDLTKRDSDLEKELLEFEKLYTTAEEKKVKTPTLKVKATSLDSSETVNLSLPQQKTLEVPQNSVSMPNTPKRQLKRILPQKNAKYDFTGGKFGFNSIQSNAEQRRLYMKGQDSGIFLRENHAALMLYQPGTSRMGSRAMGSFDENMADLENTPEINISGVDNRSYHDPGSSLGSNLLNYKQNLSVSSNNLKTLPEGVPSDDFEPTVEDEKIAKKLHRRNSNQSLMLSTHSLQSSNCSLNSAGASYHNLSTVRTSFSNFSLNSDSRKKLSLDRRDSNTSLATEHLAPTTRVMCSSNTNLTGESSKNCLLQRRGSNNSLTLNILSGNTLSRHSSNSSLNKDTKPGQKKGLLERRSSNTSLTLNINSSTPQLSVNRGLSVSNYNLNGSTCNLSRYNSNFSVDNIPTEPRKGILERRSSNTSLTLNIQPQEPRDIEIDESVLEANIQDLPHRESHRKSLSTENLIPISQKNRTRLRSNEKGVGFGSHDNLWSYSEQEYPQNLTYVCGDQENEIIYALGRQVDPNFQQGFVRNITTKPLSPQSTSEDFRLYLANMQHLQNASSVLSRQQLRDLNNVFQNGYSKVKCHSSSEGQICCSGRVEDISKENPQMAIPEPVPSQPCSEYQKKLLRNLHQEFWDMPSNFQEKPIVSGSHPKNRYKTILPNEHSRFILKEPSCSEGYINANFIKGHEYTKDTYIATQGPLQNTIYDFWKMVQQNALDSSTLDPGASTPKVQKIVMLTNFIENNRQKCEKYFPLELSEELTVANQESPSDNEYLIKNSGIIKKPGYTIRKLDVQYKNDNENCVIIVYHYWFHNWADHKCPKDVNALLNLSLDVLKDIEYDFNNTSDLNEELCKCDSPIQNSKFVFPPLEHRQACEVSVNLSSPFDFDKEACSPPTIVHCSAGIGRTGCLIAILNGIKQLSIEHKVDVLGIVCNMRLNRGGMVQNSEQYELIHKVLCLYEQACLAL